MANAEARVHMLILRVYDSPPGESGTFEGKAVVTNITRQTCNTYKLRIPSESFDAPATGMLRRPAWLVLSWPLHMACSSGRSYGETHDGNSAGEVMTSK